MVSTLPLWKMMEWVTLGIMKFPTEREKTIHVPNHQPGYPSSLVYWLAKSPTIINHSEGLAATAQLRSIAESSSQALMKNISNHRPKMDFKKIESEVMEKEPWKIRIISI